MDLPDLLEQFCSEARTFRGLAPTTLTRIRVSVRLLQRAMHLQHIGDCTDAAVRGFFYRGRSERNWTPQTYRFCDAHVGQVGFDLHSEVDLARACEAMHAQHAGRVASYDELDRFALKSTNYFDPKRMGITLERQGRVIVTPKAGTKRRRGSFMKENIDHVEFTT